VTKAQFIQLVSSEQERLRRFLLALCCGNRADAEDLAQEALMHAYLSLGAYHEREKFAAWLHRIAYNAFLDSRRRSRRTEPMDAATTIAAPGQTDDGYRYQELHAALNVLPEKERTAVLLFYLQGYAVKEIAEIMGGSIPAVKKQLERGRDKLKVTLPRAV